MNLKRRVFSLFTSCLLLIFFFAPAFGRNWDYPGIVCKNRMISFEQARKYINDEGRKYERTFNMYCAAKINISSAYDLVPIGSSTFKIVEKNDNTTIARLDEALNLLNQAENNVLEELEMRRKKNEKPKNSYLPESFTDQQLIDFLADIYDEMSTVYRYKGDFVKAFEYLQKVEELGKQIPNDTLFNLLFVGARKGVWDWSLVEKVALNRLERAVKEKKYAEEEKLRYVLLRIYNNKKEKENFINTLKDYVNMVENIKLDISVCYIRDNKLSSIFHYVTGFLWKQIQEYGWRDDKLIGLYEDILLKTTDICVKELPTFSYDYDKLNTLDTMLNSYRYLIRMHELLRNQDKVNKYKSEYKKWLTERNQLAMKLGRSIINDY